MASVADPSLIDRRVQLIAGIDESRIPIRDMHIAGITGTASARILSRDPKGPSTRVVKVPAGWGSAAPGAFTSRFELLVIGGAVEVNGERLGRLAYAGFPAGAGVESIGSAAGAVVLLWLDAPVRFGDSDEGAEAVHLVDEADVSWHTDDAAQGILRKPLASAGGIVTAIAAAVHRHGGPWVAHSDDEEYFVLDGGLIAVECDDGAAMTHSYRPGGYLYRPAGRWHGGPSSGTRRTAVTVHRSAAASTTRYREACSAAD